MRTSLRVLAVLAAGAAALSGATPPRSRAFAIEGAVQNPNNGHWYRRFPTNSQLTWPTCKANAEALGGYLVTVTSAEEAAWISSTLTPDFDGNGYFAGGTDAASEGSWTWITGEPWTYSPWYPGQPDGGTNANYLVISIVYGWWIDVGLGTGVKNYIVEWDGDYIPPPPAPPEAPSNLVASVSSGNPISLHWDDHSDNETGFEVERRTADTSFSPRATTAPGVTTFEDPSVIPGTDYTFRVRAVNPGGVSDYTNEASVTASAVAPSPSAPSGLFPAACTRDSVDLSWTDNSTNEVLFEVHRRVPGGGFELLASLPPDAWTFTDNGLPPDMEYEYGVRAVSAFRASGFCTASATTLPTLSVTATRADLRDSPRFAKDSLKVQALFDFLPESPDGVLDAIAEGITLRAGPVDRPVVMTLPKNLDTWKVRGTKATWKSAKGTTPKYSIQVDTGKRTVKATASGLELPEPPVNPMRVSVTVGDDGGTAKGDWETRKAGVFRLR